MKTEDHERPPAATDATVEAVGRFSEAYEWLIRARGSLYQFHQEVGHCSALFALAADRLSDVGHPEVADAVRLELLGRDVIEGRWTFQVVEEFDGSYWSAATVWNERVRRELMDGRPHVFEAEMKHRPTDGAPDSESVPSPTPT